tara:strand:+ start:254 stop:397 length:144 start_codon:yes stop_codon:yes gene_type:complete
MGIQSAKDYLKSNKLKENKQSDNSGKRKQDEGIIAKPFKKVKEKVSK